MTGGDRFGVATTRENVPTLGSTGLLTTWLGVAGDDEGRVIVTTLERAGSIARALDGDPVIAEVEIDGIGERGAIPWSSVTCVHFMSKQTAREFSARSYENFNVETVITEGTPALFAGPSEETPPPPPIPPGHRIVDRLAGAAAAALSLPLPPALAEERDRIVSSLLRALPDGGTESLVHAVAPLLTSDPDDTRLLGTVISSVLELHEDSEIGARAFLREITVALSDPSPGTTKSLERSMDVAKSTSPLPTFRDDHGLRSAKGLLMFALQPEPRSIATTAQTQPHDPASVLVSALLSGLFRGWTRFPAALRGDPTTKALIERAIADAVDPEAETCWMPIDQSARGAVTPPDAPLPHTGDDGALGSAVDTADAVPDAPSEQEQLLLASPPHEPTRSDAPISAQLADLLAARDMGDLRISESLATICKRLSWDDLVSTEILVGNSAFSWSEKRITIDGPVVVRRVIRSEMLDRLRSFDGPVPAEMSELALSLGATKPKRPRKSAKK